MGRSSNVKSAALGAGVSIGALNWINPSVGVATVVAVAAIVIFAMAINAQFEWRERKPEGESRRELRIKGRISDGVWGVPKQSNSGKSKQASSPRKPVQKKQVAQKG